MKVKGHIETKTACYHCGEAIENPNHHLEEKYFCCKGCQTVYEIINKSDLCLYYDFESSPGITKKRMLEKVNLIF